MTDYKNLGKVMGQRSELDVGTIDLQIEYTFDGWDQWRQAMLECDKIEITGQTGTWTIVQMLTDLSAGKINLRLKRYSE